MIDNDIRSIDFVPDELYLFHTDNPQCPSESSLWGVVSRYDGEALLLESGSTDHANFDLWFVLPRSYHFCRLATRSELRDYTYNLALFENEKHRTLRGEE